MSARTEAWLPLTWREYLGILLSIMLIGGVISTYML
jgi:hypothetical protein